MSSISVLAFIGIILAHLLPLNAPLLLDALNRGLDQEIAEGAPILLGVFSDEGLQAWLYPQ